MYKLIINLKNYEKSFGDKAIKIAKICKSLEFDAKKKNVEIILCSNAIDLRDLVNVLGSKSNVKVYAQHIDAIEPGAYTGFVIPKFVKNTGAVGSLISHSEHILKLNEIKERVEICRKLKIESCVCARNSKALKEIVKLKPNYIAIEPKELIGGDISISTAKPKLIIDSVKLLGKIPLLVGAGVKNESDVRCAIKLGAKGILVASGVVKAKDIKFAIKDLLNGF